MYDYVALRVNANPSSETITDLIADILADIDYEAFEPDENGLYAYVRKDKFDLEKVKEEIKDFPIESEFELSFKEIPGQNWNEEWELNYFKPILIEGQVVVRSSFHKDAPKAPLEILIDPKMAFGTGHHATTSGMIKMILEENMKGKRVIDMGTGTGILAILSKKLGAAHTDAIEIDPYAFENAIDNGKLNKVDLHWQCGDASNLKELEAADFFLANINLNVILGDLASYAEKIKRGGSLLLSGFLLSDREKILEATGKNGFRFINEKIQTPWLVMKFIKN